MINGLKQAPIAVWAFIIVGIFAAVGVLINAEFRTSLDSTTSFTIYNETLAATITDSVNASIAGGSLTNLSSIIISNATAADHDIHPSNFTIKEVGPLNGINPQTFNIQLTEAGGVWNLTALNITYSGTRHNQAGNVLLNATRGISNVTKQLPTVGTVIGVLLIVSAVMGLLGIFSYFRKREYGVY